MRENKSSDNNIRKRINFDEPITNMIERLKSEHLNFETQLQEVESAINNDKDIAYAAKIIRSMSESIIYHAVEEEARLLRVIMHKAKDESSESIKIMQEHNYVINFLKTNLNTIENKKTLDVDSSSKYKEDTKSVNEFISNLRNHFLEEEQIVFPLVLKAENISS
ncbi:MAG TPA: hemerythrin domain-containing protein [Nitrososphaeraceae archaeon]|jgi:iron-sulfur cluster repair protein YtfE (RIC family)|nr:hemerythrin domain-containing protein [Nitrososphaeraceae archaeon]